MPAGSLFAAAQTQPLLQAASTAASATASSADLVKVVKHYQAPHVKHFICKVMLYADGFCGAQVSLQLTAATNAILIAFLANAAGRVES